MDDYDMASKMTSGSLAMKSKLYEQYIAPLLNKKPRKGMYGFLISHSYNAWLAGINKDDLELSRFVERICNKLKDDNQEELIKLFSLVFSEQYDTGIKTDSKDRALWTARKGKNKELVISSLLDLYKVYFENEYRLWSTIIYYFLCIKYKIKTKASSTESYVNIGASEKFHAIKDVKISFLNGSPKDLAKGFDNKIRNLGAGHDRWEILDNGKIALNDVDSRSGKKRKIIELSKKDLEEYIKKCRRTIWILKTGYLVFLVNNPDFDDKLEATKEVKIKEIECSTREFAEDKSCIIKDFNLDQEKTKLLLSVKYEKKIAPTSAKQLFFGGKEAFDILHVEHETKLQYQFLDIMRYVLRQLNIESLPDVTLEMYDENDNKISTAYFNENELKKIFTSKDKYIPKPEKGEMPNREISFYSPIRMPYGFCKLSGVSEMKEKDFKDYLKKLENNK